MNDWIKTSEELPKLKKLYWITDGKDVALAKWNVDSMSWYFKYHHSVFKPTHMLQVALPPIPKEKNARTQNNKM